MRQSITYGSNTSAARWSNIEALIADYPNIPVGDIDDLMHWFDQEASAYDVAMMASNEAIRAGYLAHPVLGPRLRGCVAALQDLPGCTAHAVFGELDAKKLRSSLTLFIEAGAGPLFVAALQRWFGGEKDDATLRLLGLDEE